MNKKVIISAAIVVVVALVFLFFKYFHTECVQLNLIVEPEKPMQGQLVKFKCNAEEGETVTWDFGDSTTSAKGIEATHKFKNPGPITIKATRGENCPSQKEIVILAKRKNQAITALISYPEAIHVNEAVAFTEGTKEITSWDWKVMQTGEMGHEKSFNTKFPKAGRYTVNLYLKGPNMVCDTTFNVDVIDGSGNKSAANNMVAEQPKPAPAPAPAPKAAPTVNPKPEPKPKPEPVAVAKPEPKPLPMPEPKPEPKKKAEAAASIYMSSLDFANSFIAIANALANEDDNASNEWRDKIVPQTGDKGTMKVNIKIGNQTLEKTLEGFKKTQLISSEPYIVETVKDIKRGPKDGPITEITVVVSNKK